MEPIDKLGFYGKDPLDPHSRVFIATGDSGQGMTGAAIAAMVLADAIFERTNPLRKVWPGKSWGCSGSCILVVSGVAYHRETHDMPLLLIAVCVFHVPR